MNGRNFFPWSIDEIKKNISTICQLYSVTGEESFSAIKATRTFLREDFNQTLIRELCSKSKERIHNSFCVQTHFISTKTTLDGFQFYMVGYENDFNFITSDGIYQVKNTIGDYLTPFGTKVRWCLLVTFIGIALIVTGLTFQRKMFTGGLVRGFFHIIGIVLEQGTDLPVLTTTKSKLVTAGKIVLFFFIPSAMILGVNYKSFLKSDFSIPIPYKTSWNDLKQLVDADFEVFVPMENCKVNLNLPSFQISKSIKFCKPGDSDFWEAVMCHKHLLEQKYASFLEAVTLFDTDLVTLESGDIPKYYSTILDLGSQTTFVCLENLPEFVRTNLSNPRTAFLVFKAEFDYYWRLIQDLQIQVIRTKFGHNFRSNDSLLKKPKGLYISSTGDENYNWVHKRMNLLLTSGIYWFWEKWEQIRNGNFATPPKSSVVPTKALVMTDFELAFIVFIILLTIGSFVFATEVHLGLVVYCKRGKHRMI
ncbi:unnamed protein product [Allacma fusca]|uniref:Uncharacterized protein n=1 Tax=Allacma fusca TaxID=39272 RepID=A0A8J2KNA5_9HEXA|nr:unnamed protein product [Allacma fusca]